MANILDTLTGDGYSTRDLSIAIEKLPFTPGSLAGLFRTVGLTTDKLLLERRKGKIGLIPVSTRGAKDGTHVGRAKRDGIPFTCQWLETYDSLYADDVMGVRAFGSATELETIEAKQNEILLNMRQNWLEPTLNHHRLGAIKGIVYDADGATELYNLFTIFGLVQTTVNFDLDQSSTDVYAKCREVADAIDDALGGVPYTGIEAQCSSEFFDDLVAHFRDDTVAIGGDLVFATWMSDQIAQGFLNFGGIKFNRYRGSIGGTPMIAAGKAHFYPTGVSDLFVQNFAPSDFDEAVGSPGLPMYVQSAKDKWGTAIEYRGTSAPAIICSRPECLIIGDHED